MEPGIRLGQKQEMGPGGDEGLSVHMVGRGCQERKAWLRSQEGLRRREEPMPGGGARSGEAQPHTGTVKAKGG